MLKKQTFKRVLAVILTVVLCIGASPIACFASEEAFADAEVGDQGLIRSGDWKYCTITSDDGKDYAILSEYLGVDQTVITIPEQLDGLPVLGWGYYCLSDVIRMGWGEDSGDIIYFYGLVLGVFSEFNQFDNLQEEFNPFGNLQNFNPFDNLQDYELIIPNSFPRNIVQMWKAEGKTEQEIAQDLEHFLNLEFFCCAANAFTVLSGNDYLQSEDGVLYADNMRTLLKYPVCKQADLYMLPDSIDLYAIVRKGSYFSVNGEPVSKRPNTTYLSPFAARQRTPGDGGLTYLYPNNLTMHISDVLTDRTIKALRKDRSGKPDRYFYAAADTGWGLTLAFSGVSTICTNSCDYYASILTKDISSKIRRIYEANLDTESLYVAPPKIVFSCIKHVSGFAQWMRLIWKRFIAIPAFIIAMFFDLISSVSGSA